MPVLAHVLDPLQSGPPQAEHRPGVACAIGLQGVQGLHLRKGHPSRLADGHIHLQAGHRGLAPPEFPGILVHPLPEGGNVLFLNGKARRQLVAAEVQQQVGAGFQSGELVEPAPAAAGPLAGAAGQMDHKAGTGVFFR